MNELDIRPQKQLEKAFVLADNIVTKNYLSTLDGFPPVKPPAELVNSDVCKYASLFNVKRIVYDRDENTLQKLVNTYASAVGYGCGLAMIINSSNKETELYLGTIGADGISEARSSANALCQNFMGNFPGSLQAPENALLNNGPLEALLNKVTGYNYSGVSCVSGIGSMRTNEDVDNKNFCQGIEKFIDTMRGTEFTAIFIADLISKNELDDIKSEYELLYSSLSPFLKTELTYSESSADGVSQTLSESFSDTVTNSKSSALSVGTSQSKAHTDGKSTTKTNTVGYSKTIGTSAGVSAGIGVGVNANVGAFSSSTFNYSHSTARSENFSDTVTFGKSKTDTKTLGESHAEGKTRGTSNGTSHTDTIGKSMQISYENKTVKQLLDKIDEQLERIKESENYGVFAGAAYFLSSTSVGAKMAASAYKSLINGNGTHIENTTINSWTAPDDVNAIRSYLSKLRHPIFKVDDVNIVSPASVISGKDLAVQMGLPGKSLPGISVLETAAFGRNVDVETKRKSRSVTLGNLYHMGRDEKGGGKTIPVKLDVDSLTMHTFITGSTGSGKSNAVYSLIESILDLNDDGMGREITFMVIEPAKGEYKDKFGKRKDVSILGTNSKKSELLRINPFSFPDDVHVLEHIDRLIEIFNVCWPMYAAMPAVLKDAIERSYICAGWDLNGSECKYILGGRPIYPTFSDVLLQINAVMDDSQYSADSKGDYKGSLCTRIKSLTNGLYRQIFTSDEIQSSSLFDRNVIVDLSRVGSSETKALIMGLLVMKMQEHRMSSRTENNSALRHLTVLEEAHNLLKKTSAEQSSESSNLLGKSVEMLANSIAEMRTYGEGFVIADQAPGLLDMAAIRNTNTKIILRLPDISDRELVGKAASLNDNQILELSRLKTGVAAVYQNNWTEPVLCHVAKCSEDEAPYEYHPKKSMDFKENFAVLVDYLMMTYDEKEKFNYSKLSQIEEALIGLPFSAAAKVDILKFMHGKNPKIHTKIRENAVYKMFNSAEALSLAGIEGGDVYSWYVVMRDALYPEIDVLDQLQQDRVIAIIALKQAEAHRDSKSIELFNGLMEHFERREQAL
ncbi:MAG: DUF87 domain-containing protein [Lachnospiraceae bacterium]|nr:DUF87 domain-containing protein [Ruminococcus sp.]MCM1276879.1 DUF87 domain-containing protein [Lachnospiraceae bacterium]